MKQENNLTVEDAKLIIKLHKAKHEQKNAYWVAGQLNIGYSTANARLNILQSKDLVMKRQSLGGKIHFIPRKEAFDLAIRTLNPELFTDEKKAGDEANDILRKKSEFKTNPGSIKTDRKVEE